MKTNPIQQVLEAEAAMRDAIENARVEANQALGVARTQAAHILERNGVRTQQALKGHERRSAQALEADVARLWQEAESANSHFRDKVKKELAGIEAMVFGQIWP